MAFFKIFRNPVEMIQVMSQIQVAGKHYKKDQTPEHIADIEKEVRALEGFFELSGIPEEVTRAHSGILFEMAIKGENIPPLMALEHALLETLEEDDLEFGFVDDKPQKLTTKQEDIVDRMLKGLGREKGDE